MLPGAMLMERATSASATIDNANVVTIDGNDLTTYLNGGERPGGSIIQIKGLKNSDRSTGRRT